MGYADTTVLIPVKDEPAVGNVTKEVLKALPGCKVLIIYKGYPKGFNLGFKDKAVRIVKQMGAGKGTAMIQAKKYIDTPIFCLIDGDSTYEVKDLRKLVQLVRDGADMAFGNRFNDIREGAMSKPLQTGNRALTGLANAMFGTDFEDYFSGIRAINTKTYKSLNLTEKFFGIETELNVKMHRKGFKIIEIPTKYYKRVGGSNQIKPVGALKLVTLDFKLLLFDRS